MTHPAQSDDGPAHTGPEFWRTACWSAVWWVQAVLGLLLAVMWFLAAGPYATSEVNGGERAWVLIAAAVAVTVALAGSALLARSKSRHRRSSAVGLAGSAAVVGLCAVFVAFTILRWAP